MKQVAFWRVYKLELKGADAQPVFWKAKDRRLPYLLRLNKRKGTIYGIIWGKREVKLDFTIITQDRERIEASCKLKIE